MNLFSIFRKKNPNEVGASNEFKFTLAYIRLFFAFSVVLGHYTILGFLYNKIYRYSPYIKSHIIDLGAGSIAVAGFFVISGYLIAAILLKINNINSGKSLLYFYGSRYLRIFPLYILVILAYSYFFPSSVLVFHAESFYARLNDLLLLPRGFYSFILDHHNHVQTWTGMIDDPSWTLTLDVVFYLIAPFVFSSWYKKKIFFYAFVFILLLYALLFSVSKSGSGVDGWGDMYYSTGQANLLCFIMGMWGFLFLSRFNVNKYILYIAIFYIIYLMYFPVVPFYISPYILWGVAVLAFVYIITAIAKNGFSAHEAAVSNFTYSLYLTHVPFLLIIAGGYLGAEGAPFRTKLLWLLLEILFAIVVNKFIEGKFELLRKKFKMRWGEVHYPYKYDFTVNHDVVTIFIFALLFIASIYSLNVNVGFDYLL